MAGVLEAGCGNGATSALALSDGYGGRYVGIERLAAKAAIARDVLMHLEDPKATLR